jgi:hypothetical protein
MSHSKKKARPQKPSKDFPLFVHATGRWCKKVRGKFAYFGKIAEDPKGETALQLWLDQRDDLLAGRVPRAKRNELTVETLVNDQGRVKRWPAELRIARTGPLEMTAMALLSGWLPDADTEAELLDAAEQGLTLGDIGVKHVEDLEAAVNEVLAAVRNSAASYVASVPRGPTEIAI